MGNEGLECGERRRNRDIEGGDRRIGVALSEGGGIEMEENGACAVRITI
jgi:hypothetical protein